VGYIKNWATDKMEMLPSHFDGRRFRNLVPRRNGLLAVLRWMFSRQPGRWYRPQDVRPGAPPPPRSSEQLRVTFINHTTFLLQLNGINILTDPIWSERASPVNWAGPRRFRPPGIRFDDLPPIDLVLLSHDHYDHMDMPTLRRLQKRFGPTIYAGLKNAPLLARHGVRRVVELDWWQEATARRDLWITAVPAQHFSGRGFFDRDRRLWCGYVIHTEETCIYFAGDTGAGPHFAQVAREFSHIDLAILPIGAYRPEWFMGEVHMSPGQAVEAHRQLGARISVASHFGTFPLADDGMDEPVEVLHEVVRHIQLGESEFRVLGFGEGWQLPQPVAVRQSKERVG